MLTKFWIQRVSHEREPSRMRAALLVAAGLLLTGPARAMMLPRDPARLAAAAVAAAADYDADADAAAAGANWSVDEPPPPGLTKEEETRLLRMLLLRMMQERRLHQQDEHDAAIDAALEAAGPLLEAADIAGGGRVGDAEHPPPHAPDDKRNFRALVPTLCHFKICNMGRKRNSPPEASGAAWASL